MPIGEKLYEESGSCTGVSLKTLHGESAAVMDFTFRSKVKGLGRLKGKSGTNHATVEILAGARGKVDGVGKGILVFGKDETVTWHRVGINTVKGGRPVYAAVLRFATTSPELNWLNDIIGVVEGEIDEELNIIKRAAYEWVF